jgi:hypothetical protein
MPNASCPMPHTPFPTPPQPTPHSPCTLSNAHMVAPCHPQARG